MRQRIDDSFPRSWVTTPSTSHFGVTVSFACTRGTKNVQRSPCTGELISKLFHTSSSSAFTPSTSATLATAVGTINVCESVCVCGKDSIVDLCFPFRMGIIACDVFVQEIPYDTRTSQRQIARLNWRSLHCWMQLAKYPLRDTARVMVERLAFNATLLITHSGFDSTLRSCFVRHNTLRQGPEVYLPVSCYHKKKRNKTTNGSILHAHCAISTEEQTHKLTDFCRRVCNVIASPFDWPHVVLLRSTLAFRP